MKKQIAVALTDRAHSAVFRYAGLCSILFRGERGRRRRSALFEFSGDAMRDCNVLVGQRSGFIDVRVGARARF